MAMAQSMREGFYKTMELTVEALRSSEEREGLRVGSQSLASMEKDNTHE